MSGSTPEVADRPGLGGTGGDAKPPGMARAYRHSLVVRLTHWVNVLCLAILRSKALPTAPVRALLQQARLRLNYPPLFVVQLSSAEYQVMSRLIQSE